MPDVGKKDACVQCQGLFEPDTLRECVWYDPAPVSSGDEPDGVYGAFWDARTRGYICEDCQVVNWAERL